MTKHPSYNAQSQEVKTIPFLELIIGLILATMFWRGCWWVLDQYFFPQNQFLSNILCLTIPLMVGILWAIVAKYKFTWQVNWPLDVLHAY